MDGINDAGLTFNINALPGSRGPIVPPGKGVLNVVDLGAWLLSQFSTVDEAKIALTS